MNAMWLMAVCALITFVDKGVWSLAATQLPFYKFEHHGVLDQDAKYHLLWTPRDNCIIFEVQVATRGYVGLGFSPNGGMIGADITLGWVDNQGQLHVHDLHATGFRQPLLDESQDVEVIGGYQNDTHTVYRFSRPWVSCDEEHDFPLSEDTMRVIWAYNDEDPVDIHTFKKHTHRGTKSIFLREPTFEIPTFGEDVKIWELRAPKIEIPGDLDTLYWCQVFKIPPIARKHHIIGMVPAIEKKNLQNLHHILIYECQLPESELHLQKWIDVKGHQCYHPNMPNSWNLCNAPVLGWAVGAEGEFLSEDAGLPMGEEYGGATYFLMEIHYDNSNLQKGIIDSSGVDIYYTDNLRTYDMGLLRVGHRVSPLQIIPPGVEWTTVGHCTADCTQKDIPAEGVRVLQGLLHTHTLGAGLKLRQIRNGRELPTKFYDENYDFNYQQPRILREEMVILPGDSFILECKYQAKNRRTPTFGGFGTTEEMCLVFMLYYPRTGISQCDSQPELSLLYNTFGIQDIYNEEKIKPLLLQPANKTIDIKREEEQILNIVEGKETQLRQLLLSNLLKLVKAKGPLARQNMTLHEILHDKSTWKDKGFLGELQNHIIFGRHHAGCQSRGMDNNKGNEETIQLYNYPEFLSYTPKPPKCTP